MLSRINFKDYILNQEFTDSLSSKTNPEIPNIFNVQDLFQIGMNEEAFVESYENFIASALYSSEVENSGDKFDLSKLLDDELAAIEDVAKRYFAAVDKNSDGVIAEDEVYSISSKDGDATGISNDDLNIFTSELFKDDESSPVLSAPIKKNSKVNYKNTHSINYTPDKSGLNASADSENAINQQISEINDKFSPLLEQKKLLMADNQEYVSLISQSQQINSNIILIESNIEKIESQLQSVKFDLSAAAAELSNTNDAQIFSDYQSVIDERRAYLQNQVSSLQKQEENLNKSLKDKKSELDDLKTQKGDIDTQISNIEAENPNSQIQSINAEINKLNSDKTSLQNKLSEIRQQSLSDAEIYGKAQAYRNSELVANLLNPLLTDETKARYDKYFYESNGYSYCDQFVKNGVDAFYQSVLKEMGFSDNEIEKMMSYEKSVLASNGIDSKYIAGSEYVRECSSTKTWGEKYQNVLNACGIDLNASVDISNMSEADLKNSIRDGKIYPGMTFLTLKNGQYHVGFVESINKDMTLNTIEGNTFIQYSDGSSERGTVGSHTHNPADMSLQGASDITAKVYFWMKMSGYSDDEINKYIYKI